MKRAIVILTILICASLAFCASLGDTHTIKLKTNVGSVTPAFQLVFTSGMKDADASVVSNAEKGVFEDGAEYDEFGSNDTAVEVADISRENLDLHFSALLANNAKCTGLYTLKFSAGSFAVTRNQVSGTLDPKNQTVSASSDLSKLVGVDAEDLVQGESIKMKFNGSVCEPGVLALFSVRYDADSTLDPSKDSFYYADIALEISSDN